jgi:hypothetical protein
VGGADGYRKSNGAGTSIETRVDTFGVHGVARSQAAREELMIIDLIQKIFGWIFIALFSFLWILFGIAMVYNIYNWIAKWLNIIPTTGVS